MSRYTSRTPPSHILASFTLPARANAKPSKLAPYMDERLFRAGFDIRPIEIRHETSALQSTSSGYNAPAFLSTVPCHIGALSGGVSCEQKVFTAIVLVKGSRFFEN